MQETKPLQGVTVIDFTRLLPGPLGTHFMGEMGARVMKIESPKRMDYTRYMEPRIEDASMLFHSINHNKELVLIDYESEEGYNNLCDLIREADILVEQFRPGAMASFNLDFEKVKKINPNIVYVSLTGYGQNGQLSNKAGHDLNFIAHSGLLDMNRDKSGRPVVPGFQVADIAGGTYMLLSACTTGLLAQKLHNKPQYIDVSFMESVIPLNAIPHSMTQGGLPYKDMPILSGLFVNYDVYECKDGKWVALGALEPKFWKVFCQMVNKPEWKDKEEHELSKYIFPKAELEDLFKSKTQDEWVELSADYDCCLSPIVELENVPTSPHVKEREVFNETDINGRTIYTYSSPYKTFS